MASFEAELLKRSTGSTSTSGLAEEFAAFKTFVMQSLKALQQQLELTARDVDNLEMRSRRKMILLHGVAEHNNEEIDEVVANVVKQSLNIISFSTEDIKRSHRMGRASSSTGKPRPILVKFHSFAVKQNVWFSKTKLKGTGITLSEFLTRSRHEAFMAAREQFGIMKCWTQDGYIYVLSPDGVRHRITGLNDVNKIKCVSVEAKVAPTKNASHKTRKAVTSKK